MAWYPEEKVVLMLLLQTLEQLQLPFLDLSGIHGFMKWEAEYYVYELLFIFIWVGHHILMLGQLHYGICFLYIPRW